MPPRFHTSLRILLILLCCWTVGCGTLVQRVTSLLPHNTATLTLPPVATITHTPLPPTARLTLTPLRLQVYNMTRAAQLAVTTYPAIYFKTETYTPSHILTQVHAATQTGIASATALVCLLAYPDFCIPPNTLRKTCDQLGRYNFKVLPPDPLNYDPDHNGIGCE